MNEEIKLFKCEITGCKLTIQSCLKRQYLSKHKLKKNPAEASPLIVDYSRCMNCIQGKKIRKDNEEIYNQIIEEFSKTKPYYFKPRGRPIKSEYHCKRCEVEDEILFKKGRHTICIKCRAIYQKEYMEQRKNNS